MARPCLAVYPQTTNDDADHGTGERQTVPGTARFVARRPVGARNEAQWPRDRTRTVPEFCRSAG